MKRFMKRLAVLYRLIVGLVIVIITNSGCALLRPAEPLSFRILVGSDLLQDYPDVVTLLATVENRGPHPIELTLYGKPAHDFVVTTTDGREIWRWSYTRIIQPILISRTLQPHDYLSFEAKWDGRDNEGKPVPANDYLIYAVLHIAPNKQITTPPTRYRMSMRSLPSSLAVRLEVPSIAPWNRVEPYWKLNQSMPLKLKLRNVSDQAAQVTLLKRPAYDFVVDTPEGQEVWRWTYEKLAQDVTELQTLAPKEELAFEAEWNLHDNQDNPILPGYYCIRGILNVEPPGKIETEKCLTIGPGLPLRLTLEVPQQAQAGQSVPLKLRIENISGKVLNLTVGYAPYDFIVTTPDGTEVWRWSYGKVFPLAATSLTLQPEEVKEYSETWDQLDNEGYPASPGTYIVRGFFRRAQQENLFETEQSEPLQLIIKP